MSAPLLWIVVPLVVAVFAFFLRRWERVVTVTLTSVTLLLAFFAWWISIGEILLIGPWAIEFSDRIIFAGRLFLLENADRSFLIAIYLSLAFFFAGSLSAGVSKLFAPLGLAMSTMLVASLAVEPFLYAALFIQVAVLISIPLLSPPGKAVEQGVMRYLTFMSFGLPFMLIGGWLLSNVGSEIIDPTAFYPVLIFLGLGFAFLLAIFPLNTWIPMLMERTNPYSAAFVLSILPGLVIALLLRFMRGFPWLLDLEVLPFLGVLIVFTGGVWAAFQRDMGRILGYAVIIELGHSLLAISQPEGYPIYVAMFMPRVLALAVWALALSLMRTRVDDLKFTTVQGYGRLYPLIVLAILVAHFSVTGFPLLASFPMLLALLEQLVQHSVMLAVLTLLGSAGLMVSGLRSLAVFVMGPDELPPSDAKFNRLAQVYLILGMIAIVLVGIFPHWFFGFFSNVARVDF
jgi:formate hydrogenlyase subunit 3/multisubunit Na+/H+ antiporter MnhD subunit